MYDDRVKGTQNRQRVIIFNVAEANLVFVWGSHWFLESKWFLNVPTPTSAQTNLFTLLSTSQWSSCFALIGLIGALGLLHEETETGLIYEISECGNLIRPLGLWQDDT